MKSPYYIDQEANPAVTSTKKTLEHALYEAGVSLDVPDEHTGVTGFYADNIRINKLAYAVVEQYDLPAVRTWYKYGQYLPYDQLRPKNLDISQVTKLDEYVHSGRKRDYTVRDLVNRLQEFNLSSLFEMDTYEFLKKNYEGFAPEELKLAYLASTEVIRVLQEATKASAETIRSKVSAWREQIQEAALDIEYATENISYLPASAAERLNWFVDTLADLLIAIECSSGIPSGAIEQLDRARDYYHGTFWPITAMSISIEEVTGPDAEHYQTKGRGIRNQLESNAEAQKGKWESDLNESGLTPTVSERQSVVADGKAGIRMFDAALQSTNGN